MARSRGEKVRQNLRRKGTLEQGSGNSEGSIRRTVDKNTQWNGRTKDRSENYKQLKFQNVCIKRKVISKSLYPESVIEKLARGCS